jgi:hypothetical protein
MPAKTSTKANTKTSRCWPGYEPVPGKREHEEGSCRKKPASRNGGEPVSREKSRKKQIALGGARAKQAKSKSRSAGERHRVSKTRKAA